MAILKNSTLTRIENEPDGKTFVPNSFAFTMGEGPTALVDTNWLMASLTYRAARLSEDIDSLIEKGNLEAITEYVPLWVACIHDMQEAMQWMHSKDAMIHWRELSFEVVYPGLQSLGINLGSEKYTWTITQTRSAA